MAFDFASMLLRKSVGSMASERARCSECRRTPLTGELLHVFEGDRVLCDLCLAEVSGDGREPDRSERMHASERPISVRRAA